MTRTSKTTAALAIAALLVLSCAALQGAEGGFDDIVHAISDQLHARPTRIPFFNHLAVFEDLDSSASAPADLSKVIRSADGNWRPFVQVRSRTETVLVYMIEERGACKLLVVASEHGEVTVVELKLNAEAMQAWLNGDRRLKALSTESGASRD
jgi:hypothetical protein